MYQGQQPTSFDHYRLGRPLRAFHVLLSAPLLSDILRREVINGDMWLTCTVSAQRPQPQPPPLMCVRAPPPSTTHVHCQHPVAPAPTTTTHSEPHIHQLLTCTVSNQRPLSTSTTTHVHQSSVYRREPKCTGKYRATLQVPLLVPACGSRREKSSEAHGQKVKD